MGRAVIQANLGAGLYSVKRIRDTARAAQRKTLITAELAKTNQQIAQDQGKYATQNSEFNTLMAQLDALIAAMDNPPTDAQLSAVDSKTAEALRKKTERNLTAERIASGQIAKVKAEKLLAQIDAAIAEPAAEQAWSVDYQLSLSGTVAIAEINDEHNAQNKTVKIFTGGPTDLDHQPTISNGPSGTLYNIIALPAKQKWLPLYRLGTITSLSGNNCNVTLSPATSSQLKLNINQADSLSNVPIVYGSCNGAVFEVGDIVVVQFQGQLWANARVVGFAANPRECPSVGGPIPWNDTNGVRYKSNAVVNIYHPVRVQIIAAGSTPGPEGFGTAINPNSSSGESVSFKFVLAGQQTTALLFNFAETAPLDVGQTYPYDNVFWTADIPSYWFMNAPTMFNIDSYIYELSGSNIINRNTGNVVFTDVSIVNMPYSQLTESLAVVAVDVALPTLDAADFQFTMAFDNGTQSGTHAYRYKSGYVSAGKNYVIFEKVPD